MANEKGFIVSKANEEGVIAEYSKPLTVDQANILVDRVEGSTEPIVLQATSAEGGTPERILGFNFDRKDVLDALGDEADSIYLAVAERQPNDFDTESDVAGYSLVLFPVKDGHIIREDYRIFDYSKPCKCNCPRTGQTC